MKDSLIYTVEQLLKKNNIFFDKQELIFQIQSHPSYPSLHAITGVLDHFNIDNVAAEVPQNVETLLQLPNCFLAQIETAKGKELVTVVRKKSDYFLLYPSQEKEKNTESDFLKKFTGIIVVLEKELSENKQTSNSLNGILVSLFTLLTLSVFAISKPAVLTLLFFFTSLIGVLISISIYKQELGLNSLIGDAFCASSDGKKDCDAVLSSKGATIFKGYKLSDFSLIYFVSFALATFLISIKNASFNTLSLLSLLTLPITVYSIYYQLKIKKWCFLCLSIVAVLWIQTLFVIADNTIKLSVVPEDALLVFFCFSLVIFVWSILKPTLKNIQEGKKTKIEFFKFKRNYNLFSSLLNSSPQISTQLKSIPEIVFGNKHSQLEIVIITNPFCGHCKPVHQLVENILEKYENEVKIIVRFNINATNKESDGVKVTSRLLEIYNTKETKTCLTAMGEIYEGETVNNWLKKWGECYEKEEYTSILKIEKEWCATQNINFTPEILVNGKPFPKEYYRSDLIYFIEDLNENCCLNNTENINKELELSA